MNYYGTFNTSLLSILPKVIHGRKTKRKAEAPEDRLSNLNQGDIVDSLASLTDLYSSSKIDSTYQKKAIGTIGSVLTVDEKGDLVTLTPQRVCWTSLQNSQTSLTTTYQTVIYKDAITNYCNYYDTTTGIFFPKRKGTYYIFASVNTTINNGISVQLMFIAATSYPVLEFYGTTTATGSRHIPFNGTSDKLRVEAKVTTATAHNAFPFRNYFESYFAFD